MKKISVIHPCTITAVFDVEETILDNKIYYRPIPHIGLYIHRIIVYALFISVLLIFIIAIIAFGISSSFAKLTISEDVDSYKLISIENNSFKPNYIDEVPTIIETTNTTNSTNSTYSDNTTYTDNYTGYDNNYGGYSNYTYGDIVTTTDYSEYW